MSAALDALLAELAPPPVPAGLAERIAAAAQATAQEPHGRRARHAAAWRDRRGRWRRGLVTGAAAVGLAFSGAVAATLAGVPLPAKVEAVIAKLPLIGKEAPETAAPAPRSRPVERAAVRPEPLAESAPKPALDPVRMHESRQMRRLAAARRIVEARRAAGLPTPRADRIERRIQRRMEWWRQATPEQRQRHLERRRERQEARRARIEARRGPMMPTADAPPVATGPMQPRLGQNGPVYGPLDPRAGRTLADDGQPHRLRGLRERRLERLRQRRLERQGAPPATRPAPVRRAPPAVRREGLRPTAR